MRQNGRPVGRSEVIDRKPRAIGVSVERRPRPGPRPCWARPCCWALTCCLLLVILAVILGVVFGLGLFNSKKYESSGSDNRQTDLNECVQTPDICGEEMCENLVGSYACVPCPAGQVYSRPDRRCVEKVRDQCWDSSDCKHKPMSTCVSSPGGGVKSCQCNTGFSDYNGICKGSDDCVNSPCQNGATCVNGEYTYECKCLPGFAGIQCEYGSGPIVCSDPLICSDKPGSDCVPTVGDMSYTCQCRPGMQDIHGVCIGTAADACANPGTCAYKPGSVCTPTAHGAGWECKCRDGLQDMYGVCTPYVGGGTSVCYPGQVGVCDASQGRVCVPSAGGYRCECRPGTVCYTAVGMCVDIDECMSYPCRNGGTCLNCDGYYTCTCPPGFSGTNCEIAAGCDLASPCMNGGGCQSYSNSYICNSCQGYTGQLCNIPIGTAPASCLQCKNGYCSTGTYRCVCFPGYTGTDCNYEIDECASNPCGSNGRCVDRVNAFYCECSDGYSGPSCMETYRQCDSYYCQNGWCAPGYDQNGLWTQYTCQCYTGFTGSRCDIPTNVCDSATCVNGACRPQGSGYSCVCNPGYCGDYCDQIFSSCENSPCVYGTCQSNQWGFSCLCSPGYYGQYCDQNTMTGVCSATACEPGRGYCQITNKSPTGYICNCYSGYTGDFCELDLGGIECTRGPYGALGIGATFNQGMSYSSYGPITEIIFHIYMSNNATSLTGMAVKYGAYWAPLIGVASTGGVGWSTYGLVLQPGEHITSISGYTGWDATRLNTSMVTQISLTTNFRVVPSYGGMPLTGGTWFSMQASTLQYFSGTKGNGIYSLRTHWSDCSK